MSAILDPKNLAPWQIRGLDANPKATLLDIECIAFRYGTEHGRFYHMKRLANLFFSKEQNPDMVKPLLWNPWTVRICRTLCDGYPSLGLKAYPFYTGITGPASSSKTYSCALYTFLLWFSSPMQTKGVVSSTSIQSAKGRIWADVLHFANSVPRQYVFYQINTSNPAMIKLPPPATPRESIELIAGEESQQEASGKVIGIKNQWFILVVDEATEVSHALFEARENISKNTYFQIIFIGNAKNHDDPHGKMCEPVGGWDTVNIDMDVWRTVHYRGICLHFDGLKSPNLKDVDIGSIKAGEESYDAEVIPFPGLFAKKDLVEAMSSTGGAESRGFQRMTRGFWVKGGTEDQIYTPQDLELNGAHDKPIWLEKPRRIMGHDPAFSTDGDASKAVICDVGLDKDRMPIMAHVATENVDVDQSEDKRRNFSMASELKRIAEKYGVEIEDIGVDNTGTGQGYPEIIDEVFGGGHCIRVPFNGPVSSVPYPSDGLTEPGEMFVNRVSEIWYVARLYLQKRQLRGIKPSLAKSMAKRLFDRVRQNKICVETKRNMRKRGVSSPDEADAYFIALDLARSKLNFAVWTGPGTVEKPKRSFKDWVKKKMPNQKVLELGKGGWQSFDLRK